MKRNIKVRRVDTTQHNNRISLHPVKISGFQPKLLYVLLRTLTGVTTRRCGLRLRVPPVPKQLGLREYRKINVVRLPARQLYYSTLGASMSNRSKLGVITSARAGQTDAESELTHSYGKVRHLSGFTGLMRHRLSAVR